MSWKHACLVFRKERKLSFFTSSVLSRTGREEENEKRGGGGGRGVKPHDELERGKKLLISSLASHLPSSDKVTSHSSHRRASSIERLQCRKNRNVERARRNRNQNQKAIAIFRFSALRSSLRVDFRKRKI